ncbi:hypothetical protein, partial [Serratia sp. ME47]|uniref:hypothetical protein n=2 Tax=unclassified Serratia (in: enterobacteria) TaxID=2647522 RepID=UPI001C711AD9
GFLPHTGCRQSNPGSARIQQKAPVRQLTAEGYMMKVKITTTGGAVREADLAEVEFLPEHYGAIRGWWWCPEKGYVMQLALRHIHIDSVEYINA